jgi:hypothetical protein
MNMLARSLYKTTVRQLGRVGGQAAISNMPDSKRWREERKVCLWFRHSIEQVVVDKVDGSLVQQEERLGQQLM